MPLAPLSPAPVRINDMPSGRSTSPTESLLTPAAVRLFGRVFDGVTLTAPMTGSDDAAAHGYTGHRLSTLLRTSAATKSKAAGQPAGRLARIYAFIYQGHYYRLAMPTVFLVAGGWDPERSSLLQP